MSQELGAAVAALVEAFGASHAPGSRPPSYSVGLNGSRLMLRTEDESLEEEASEWKRLCGRLWAMTFSEERRQAEPVLWPTLCAHDGAYHVPTGTLLDSEEVAAALQTIADLLVPAHPDEARCCLLSTAAGQLQSPRLEATKASRALDAAFKTRRSLSSSAMVTLCAPLLDDPDPVELIGACVTLRFGLVMSSPKSVLGMDRTLTRTLLPLARDRQGLVREAAMSVIEVWAVTLVSRGAYVEAVRWLALLVEYGAIPRALAMLYPCQIVLGDEPGAALSLKRMWAIAGPSAKLPDKLYQQASIHNVEAAAYSNSARFWGLVARGESAFQERRRKGEPGPPARTAEQAREVSRAHAAHASDVLEHRVEPGGWREIMSRKIKEFL